MWEERERPAKSEDMNFACERRIGKRGCLSEKKEKDQRKKREYATYLCGKRETKQKTLDRETDKICLCMKSKGAKHQKATDRER